MELWITWRIDTEEYYTTDSLISKFETWDDVLREIKIIEGAGCTVLAITRFVGNLRSNSLE
jgi:hypothetical protein